MPTNHPITSHNEPGTSSTASSSPSPTSTNHHIREDEELLQQQQQQQEQQAQEEQQRQQLLKLQQIQQLIEANKVRDCQSDDEIQLPNQQHLYNDGAYNHLLNNDQDSHNNIPISITQTLTMWTLKVILITTMTCRTNVQRFHQEIPLLIPLKPQLNTWTISTVLL